MEAGRRKWRVSARSRQRDQRSRNWLKCDLNLGVRADYGRGFEHFYPDESSIAVEIYMHTGGNCLRSRGPRLLGREIYVEQVSPGIVFNLHWSSTFWKPRTVARLRSYKDSFVLIILEEYSDLFFRLRSTFPIGVEFEDENATLRSRFRVNTGPAGVERLPNFVDGYASSDHSAGNVLGKVHRSAEYNRGPLSGAPEIDRSGMEPTFGGRSGCRRSRGL